MKLKLSSKIGWILVALSVVLSVWVLSVGSSKALSEDEYTLENGALTISDSVTAIDASAFAGNTTITSATIPYSVVSIGSSAFSGCTELTSVSLTSGLSTIGDQAFYNTGLTSVSIPATVTSIGSDAFANNPSLTSITVASGSSAYSSSDGALYNASTTRLIWVPEGKGSITIPSTCTTIGSGAFAGNDSITTVSLPATVTTIESGAFTDSAVTTLYIYGTDTTINSLGGSISTIYGYAGSTAETYAQNNAIDFIVIGNSSSDDNGGDNGGDSEDEVTYTITFNPNGGTIDGSTGNITYTVVEGNYTTVPSDPVLSGYVFSGWSSSVSGMTVDSAITSDVTFTAGWTKASTTTDTYTVVFDVNGGAEHYDAQTITSGETVTNPGTPTRSGYTFMGWYHGGTAWDFDNDTVSSNMTLIAWWKSNSTGSVSNGTGAATLGTGSSGGGSGSSTGSTGSGHTLDATPKTADGDLDPRLALCAAILLAGIGMLIYGNQTKLQFLASKNKK